MSDIRTRYRIYDGSPAGLLRVARRFVGRAVQCLSSFEFQSAVMHLTIALELLNALALELDPPRAE